MNKGMYYDDKKLDNKKELQKEIERQKESFFRRGGKIKELEKGESAYELEYKDGKIVQKKIKKQK